MDLEKEERGDSSVVEVSDSPDHSNSQTELNEQSAVLSGSDLHVTVLEDHQLSVNEENGGSESHLDTTAKSSSESPTKPMKDHTTSEQKNVQEEKPSLSPPVTDAERLMIVTPLTDTNTKKLPVPGTPMPFSAILEEIKSHDQQLVIVEQEFQEAQTVLSQDEAHFGKFRVEFERMRRVVQKSNDRLQKLFKSFEELFTEYTANHETTQERLKGHQSDEATLKGLREQIRNAEEQVDSCNRREDSAKEELRQIKQEISNLSNSLKQGVGLSTIQERALNDLMQAKEQSTRELEAELDKIVRFRNSIAEISDKIRTTDSFKRELEQRIFELKEHHTQKKTDIDNEMRNKERLERDLRELRVVVSIKSQEVRGKQDAANRATDDISILESQIKSQRSMLEKLRKDQENLQSRASKLQQDCDDQSKVTNEIVEENELMQREYSIKEKDFLKNRAEIKKINRLKDALIKKNRSLEEEKVVVEAERKDLKAQIEEITVETDRLRRELDIDKKTLDDLIREKDLLDDNLEHTQGESEKHHKLVALQQQTTHNLELELQRYRQDVNQQLKVLSRLKSERDMYVDEAVRLQSQCVKGLQSIKERELQIYEFKKKMVQSETKLKHQQNLYEAVQSDRNLHCKHLIESQAEISEMKRRLKVMNYQINGFKEDITSKEEALTREVAENQKLSEDIQVITDEIKTLKNQNEIAQAYIRSQSAEEFKLNQFVKEAEMERSRQENAVQVLISERDNLSAQLIRQNEELTKVYDKIKTQQSSLIRSENHYAERLKTIGNLQRRIALIKHQRRMLQRDTEKRTVMKHTICRMQNELVREKTRMKALEEELENPVNVHRWRKLEGSNPKAFEMIQVLHALQKKLIAKAQEDKEKEEEIQKKEETYLQLKATLAKQVGPEALEQLTEFQQTLKDKNMQLRHMDTELNMYQAQIREHRYAVEKLDGMLVSMKWRYVELSRGKILEYSGKRLRSASTATSTISGVANVSWTPFPNLPPLPSLAPSDADSRKDGRGPEEAWLPPTEESNNESHPADFGRQEEFATENNDDGVQTVTL